MLMWKINRLDAGVRLDRLRGGHEIIMQEYRWGLGIFELPCGGA